MPGIMYKNTMYAGGSGGGTTVVANPSGAATSRLNKIQIGENIYDTSDKAVSYEASVTTGELIGYINVGETRYPVYAPEGGGGGSEGDGQMVVQFSEVNKVPTLTAIDYKIEALAYTPIDIILTSIMTSNTTPTGVGTVSCSSYYNSNNNYNAWQAFKGQSCNKTNCQDGWLPAANDSAPFIMYTWTSEQTFSRIIIETCNNATDATRTITIEGLTSNNTWENCLKTGTSESLDFIKDTYTTYDIELNGNSYTAFRITGDEAWYLSGSAGYACTISEIQIKYIASS